MEELPAPVSEMITGAEIYDSSFSKEARVFFVDKEDGLFLKEAKAGMLKNEALMTSFFHSRGLSAEVLYYDTIGSKDYFITRRIPGENCIHEMYLKDPERLCDTIAGRLRSLHETDPSGCPVLNRIETYRNSVLKGIKGNNYDLDLFEGIWDFGSVDEVIDMARQGLSKLKAEVLIHGDYCLPNIILNKWRFSGFIDVGNGGLGDRHIDILWGIWTLKYNLKTAEYTDRFKDAYGRDIIDDNKLRVIAAMEIVGG